MLLECFTSIFINLSDQRVNNNKNNNNNNNNNNNKIIYSLTKRELALRELNKPPTSKLCLHCKTGRVGLT